jgi:hypothetical protein
MRSHIRRQTPFRRSPFSALPVSLLTLPWFDGAFLSAAEAVTPAADASCSTLVWTPMSAWSPSVVVADSPMREKQLPKVTSPRSSSYSLGHKQSHPKMYRKRIRPSMLYPLPMYCMCDITARELEEEFKKNERRKEELRKITPTDLLSCSFSRLPKITLRLPRFRDPRGEKKKIQDHCAIAGCGKCGRRASFLSWSLSFLRHGM